MGQERRKKSGSAAIIQLTIVFSVISISFTFSVFRITDCTFENGVR